MVCPSCGNQLFITNVNGSNVQVCVNQNCPQYAGNNLNIPRQAKESVYQSGELSETIPTGGTSGQVLAKASDDDLDVEWVTGGAQLEFTRFNALSTSTASIANTNVDIPWNTERKKDGDFTHSANSTDVTCNFTGEVEVIATARTTGGNRVEAILTLLINNVAQTGAIDSNYMSRDTDQNTGSVTLHWWTTVTSGDIIKINVQGDTDGTATLTTGTRIDIKRVS